MAKVTRAVKGVAKATANKRAKKVVTTGRDSKTMHAALNSESVRGKRIVSRKDPNKPERLVTYNDYMGLKRNLTGKEATDFLKLLSSRSENKPSEYFAAPNIRTLKRYVEGGKKEYYDDYYEQRVTTPIKVFTSYMNKIKKNGASAEDVLNCFHRLSEALYIQKHAPKFPK